MKLTLEEIRKAKEQLVSANVAPVDRKYVGHSLPQLRDGIVWLGAVAAMHPGSYIDMFGVKAFRKLKRDISKARVEKFIKKHKRMKSCESSS